MGRIYLANAFSLNMLPLHNVFAKMFVIEVAPLTQRELCGVLREREVVNAIGHQSTVDLVNSICGTKLTANRTSIRLERGDKLIIIQITERLPEGKILTAEELNQLLQSGKIAFYMVTLLNTD